MRVRTEREEGKEGGKVEERQLRAQERKLNSVGSDSLILAVLAFAVDDMNVRLFLITSARAVGLLKESEPREEGDEGGEGKEG